MKDMDPNDFYEDDEPIEKIVAAFNRGDKGVTAEPPRGINETLHVPGLIPIISTSSNQTIGPASVH